MKKCKFKNCQNEIRTLRHSYCDTHAVSLQFTGRDMNREKVRIRDNHKCTKCQKVWQEGQIRFDVHHLKGLCGKKSRGYDKTNELQNLTTLCHRCHMGLHGKSKKSRWGFYKTEKGKHILSRISDFRKNGMGFDEIAILLGMTYSNVHRAHRLYNPKVIPTLFITSS